MKQQQSTRPAAFCLAWSASAPMAAQTIERTLALAPTPDELGGFSAHFGDDFTAASSGNSFVANIKTPSRAS